MKLSRAALFAAAVAIPAGFASVPAPAHAQNILDNLLNGNRQDQQRAFEQGRREQAHRDRDHRWDNGDRAYNDRHDFDHREYGYNNDREDWRGRGYDQGDRDRGDYHRDYGDYLNR